VWTYRFLEHWSELARTVDNLECCRSLAVMGTIGGYRQNPTFTGLDKNGSRWSLSGSPLYASTA
jgi:hypothetical protein